METITRKSLLYKSGLGFYCINHVRGCSHGCRYPCYASMMARSHGRTNSYEDWCRPRLVGNAVALLETELSRRKEKPDSIHLCLTTDPFMAGYPEIAEMSMTLVAISNSHGIPCSLLTKGLLPAHLADRLRFPMDNVHEISLISLDEDFRERWEPGTAPYKSRILALKYLHDRGRRTVVHIEPYPTPNLIVQDLKDILTAVEFADGIYFSGWNYNALVRQYPRFREFYRDQTDLVKRFCRERGKTCETGE